MRLPWTAASRRTEHRLSSGRPGMSNEVVLLGCGDVGPIHEPMAQYSELVRETLAGADIRFAQVERVYSERGTLQPHRRRAWQAAAAHGVRVHRLRFQRRFGRQQSRDGLGSGGAARHDRATARQGHPDRRRRAQSRRSAAAGNHRSQGPARRACWPIARCCTKAMPRGRTRRVWRRCAPRPVRAGRLSAGRSAARGHDARRGGSGEPGR